jgi:signal peptidase I
MSKRREPESDAAASNQPPVRKKRQKYQFLIELESFLIEIVYIAAALLVIYCFLFGFQRVTDESMFPNARDGDLVIYYRLDKDYASRDLVVIEANGKKQVRRVVATAGETVNFENGKLVLDGIPQKENGIYQDSEQFVTGPEFPLTVGEGEIFVLADAREEAEDSRIYGPVKTAETYGTVMLVIRRRDF